MRESPLHRRTTRLALYIWLWLGADIVVAQQDIQRAATADPPPNFLLIVADDLGWSDIGAYGGEIRTPNLDALAQRGLAMSQFYVAPQCAPTRAMLLTGVDHHAAGVGTMDGTQAANQRRSVNYAGQLHDGVVTVAEVLRAENYRTALAGKWHLAVDPSQHPHRRGFERSFALLNGGASHFGDGLGLHEGQTPEYLEDGQPVALPADFYSSIAYTDKLLDYLRAGPQDKPFFAYLAYTAPHDPIQVPDAWLDRYAGVYDDGPTALRARRVETLRALGLFPAQAPLWQALSFPSWTPMYQAPWEERPERQRARDARAMELYAAMIELLDQQVGRVIDFLDRQGTLANTYVLFLSDNGASGQTPLFYPGTTREWFLAERDNRLANMGRPGSHVFMAPEWASASATPWRLFKSTVGDGGIRAPLVVAGPGIAARGFVDDLSHVTDIVPSLYALAGIDAQAHPRYIGKLEPQGRSLAGLWREGEALQQRALSWELLGNRAIRRGCWKASNIFAPLGSGDWELFDVCRDPGETSDIASQHGEVLQQLIDEYGAYAERNGVILPQPRMRPDMANLYVGECDWWCELRFSVLRLLRRLRS